MSKESNECNIKVLLRCRPLNEQEKVSSTTHQVVQCNSKRKEISAKVGNGTKATEKTYTYDGVFGPSTSQKELFDASVTPILDEVLSGFNCTIFAYGQTGTGKTHTMEGVREMVNGSLHEAAGIIPRSIKYIFDKLASTENAEYTVRVSHLELYNEELTDLLTTEKKQLRMFEDPHNRKVGKDNVQVHPLEEVIVQSASDIMKVLDKSLQRRQVAETKLNDKSSRSHSIFTVIIHTKETTVDGEDLLKVGKLNLVDLAGSECIGRSGAQDKRAKEAGMINQSLLTLGRVINSLVDHHPHIPYRESKLTRLLQDSLGGKTKTCIIATISPSSGCIEETVSTLDYAHRAKNIRNKPEVNQKMTKKALIKEYVVEIEKLKDQLNCMREKDGVYLPVEQYDGLNATVQSQANQIKDLEASIQSKEEAVRQLEAEGEEKDKDIEHLTGKATELITTVEETVDHVDRLHSKLERKSEVESTNITAAKSFGESMSEYVGGMVESVDTFAEGQMERTSAIKSHVQGFVGQANNQLSSLEEQLAHLKTMSVEQMSAVTAILSSSCDTVRDDSAQHRDASVASTKATLAILNGFKSAIGVLFNSVSQSVHLQKAQMKEWEKGITRDLEETSSNASTLADGLKERITDMSETVTAAVARETENIHSYQQQISSISSEENTKCDAEIGELLSGITDLVSNFAKGRKVSMEEHAATVSSALDKSVSEMKTLESMMKSKAVDAEDKIASVADSAKEGANAARESISAQVEGACAFHDETCALVGDSRASMEKDMETAEIKLSAIAESCENLVDANGKTTSSMEQSFADHREEFEKSVRSQHTVAEEHLTATVGDLGKSLDGFLSQHGELADSHSTFMCELQGDLKKAQERFTEYVSDGMKMDVPTGATPMRRDFTYPKTAHLTRPRGDVAVATENAEPVTPSVKTHHSRTVSGPHTPLHDISNQV